MPGSKSFIHDQFMRHAPPGQYRVIGVDAFDGTDWVAGDFPTRASTQGFLAQHTKESRHAEDVYLR